MGGNRAQGGGDAADRLVPTREQWAASAAVAAGQGALVVVSGASGIGRSAVVARAAALYDGVTLSGGGLSGLRNVANLALTRALRLPVPVSDPTRTANFVVAAAGRASLLVIDDLQLCDSSTLETVALLAGQLPVVVAVSDDSRGGAALAAALGSLPWAVPVALGPLGDDEAAQVVRDSVSTDSAVVRAAVRSAGGNPGALVAFARDPGAASMRAAVANRLAQLDPESRTVLCLLGLAGRPLDASVVGNRLADAAARSGVVVGVGGTLSARSNLDVEVAVAVLPAEVRRSLHAELARRLPSAAERAHHLEGAGDLVGAVTAARQAAEEATSAGERIRHQARAARLGPEEGRAEACLGVALAASDLADHQVALELTRVAARRDDPRSVLVAARATLAMGEAYGALEVLNEATLPTADHELGLLLRVERARALCLVDPLAAMHEAAEAYGAASTTDELARAGGVLGAAQLAAGADGWQMTLEAAETQALDCGLPDVAFAAASNRCSGMLRAGCPEGAFILAGENAALARELGSGNWSARFETVMVWVSVHARGSLAEGVSAGEAFLDAAAAPALRREVTAHVALAYADSGQLAEGRARLAGVDVGHDDLLGWCDAELEAIAGDPAAAGAKAVAVALRARRWPVPALASVTAAWAGHMDVTTAVGEAPAGGAGAELAALAVRACDPGRASELFADASGRWVGVSRRSVLRCRLAAAVAFADGDRQGALLELRALAADLEGEEMTTLAAQVARVRRRLGDPDLPSAPGGPRTAGLSRREAEVMALVGEGLTSATIAARLAVAPSTVETHVKSAMRKLGASTRTEGRGVGRSMTASPRSHRPPPPVVLVCDDLDDLGDAAAALGEDGWTTRAGFTLPAEPWDLTSRRWVCRGSVGDTSDAEAAIWALVRGCALVVVAGPGAPTDFGSDLARAGRVRQFNRPADGDTKLSADEEALLAALAGGLSVQQAAAQLYLSGRTAQRRLAAARGVFGVRTTREAVLAWTRLTADRGASA